MESSSASKNTPVGALVTVGLPAPHPPCRVRPCFPTLHSLKKHSVGASPGHPLCQVLGRQRQKTQPLPPSYSLSRRVRGTNVGGATQKPAQSTLGALWGCVGKAMADRISAVCVKFLHLSKSDGAGGSSVLDQGDEPWACFC